VNNAIIGTCDHCDLQEVQSLSAKILDSLTDASLNENSGAFPSPNITKTLKDDLMSFLGLGRIIQSSSSAISLNPLSIPTDFSVDLDPSLDIQTIQRRLERGGFVAYLQSKKSAWGKVSILSSEYSRTSHSDVMTRLLLSFPLMALLKSFQFVLPNSTTVSSLLSNGRSSQRL
jgi:hypothetical protein